jgi:hypothetical protein
MNINPSEPMAIQPSLFYKLHDFVMLRNHALRKCPQQIQDLRTILHRSASQLTNDKRMAEDFIAVQEATQLAIALTQMINPNRCINECHAAFLAFASGQRLSSFPFLRDLLIGARFLWQSKLPNLA